MAWEMLQNHTVRIGDFFSCFAQNPQSERPNQKHRYDEVKIDNGLTKKYRVGIDPRRLKFTSTIIYPVGELRDILGKIEKERVSFSSEYIGSFDALITTSTSYPDGTVNVTVVDFDVEEVE